MKKQNKPFVGIMKFVYDEQKKIFTGKIGIEKDFSMESLKIRKLKREKNDLLKLKVCFDASFSKREISHFEWLYFNNPIKRSFVQVATDIIDGKEIIGASYTVIPLFFKMGDKTVMGVQSLDTVTDKPYRKKGLFLKLANAVYENCALEGVSFVYGFPNNNSAHGIFKRLGWLPFDHVPYMIKPLRTSYFLRPLSRMAKLQPHLVDWQFPGFKKFSMKPNQFIVDDAPVDRPEMDALWTRFSDTFTAGLARNRAYLKWRLEDAPYCRYRTSYIYERGRLKGFVSYVATVENNGLTGRIMELMYDAGQSDDKKNRHMTGAVLLNHAVEKLKKSGCQVVKAICFRHSFNYAAYEMNGFFHKSFIPGRPSHYFGLRCFKEEDRIIAENPLNWYLSFCDFDPA